MSGTNTYNCVECGDLLGRNDALWARGLPHCKECYDASHKSDKTVGISDRALLSMMKESRNDWRDLAMEWREKYDRAREDRREAEAETTRARTMLASYQKRAADRVGEDLKLRKEIDALKAKIARDDDRTIREHEVWAATKSELSSRIRALENESREKSDEIQRLRSTWTPPEDDVKHAADCKCQDCEG